LTPMTRVYETVTEQKARELRTLYASGVVEPADFPPPSAPHRSKSELGVSPFGYVTTEDLVKFRFQTVEQTIRRQVDQAKRRMRTFTRLTKTPPY
jgi:hypothetical protein